MLRASAHRVSLRPSVAAPDIAPTFLLLTVLIAAVTTTAVPAAAAPPSDQSRAAVLVDKARRAADRPPLDRCAELDAVADQWSATMARSGSLSHHPDAAAQIGAWRSWGENVGYGSSINVVHDGFMRSAGHRSSVLSRRYTQVGLGVADVSGRTWVTQVFRLPRRGARCTPVAD